MPLDIDEIRKGRRREWDSLLDPEERKRREREEKDRAEEELEKKGLLSFFKHRRRRKGRETDKIQAEWSKAKRDVVVTVVVVVALMVTLFGIQTGWRYARRQTWSAQIETMNKAVVSGRWRPAFSQPEEAWMSWRAGWLKQDARAIFRTYSTQKVKGVTGGGRSDQAYIASLQRSIESGSMSDRATIAADASTIKWLTKPGKNPRDGELAVFETPPIYFRETDSEITYAVALVWQEPLQEWRFHVHKPMVAWRENWDHINDITRENAL